ncbi:MAG: KEOPS complex kinase/ATPase Bud32 [Candidatus Thermoplasmatota archaeon]
MEMKKNRILYQGAEAKIVLDEYLDKRVVKKKRIPKKYRIKEIDDMLIKSRTKEEAKLMSEARKHGVSVPIIYDVDLIDGVLTMEFIDGEKVKDILEDIGDERRVSLCKKIGKSIACLHDNDIIHGDITTSNMILRNNRVYFIDFGLGCKASEVEAKGVDLHVLMEAFESTHSQYEDCFKHVFESYREELNKTDGELVVKKIEDIVRRGRYR